MDHECRINFYQESIDFMQDPEETQLVPSNSIPQPPHKIPIYALVDCDVYGIDIYACYKFGSKVIQEVYRIRRYPLILPI